MDGRTEAALWRAPRHGGKPDPGPGGGLASAGVPGAGPSQLLVSHALPSSAAELWQSQVGNESLPRTSVKVLTALEMGKPEGTRLPFPQATVALVTEASDAGCAQRISSLATWSLGRKVSALRWQGSPGKEHSDPGDTLKG